MTTLAATPSIDTMKRTLLVGSVLLLAPVHSFAQETAAGGQAAATPDATTNAPAAMVPAPATGAALTPPADNAPAATPAPDAAPATAPTTPAATTTTTTTTSTSGKKLSSREIRQLQQQEIVRRQELIYRADESLRAARKAEVAQQYPEARKDYLFSAEAYSAISRSTNSYATAAEGLTRVDFQLFDDALKAGDTARAKRLMDEVLKFNPNNQLAQEKELAINRAINDPNNTTMLGNPAVTPGFVKRVNEVQQLFAEAEQFRRTGQWNEAEARLKRIIGIDPYNIAANKELERITAQKMDYDEHARLETRDERLRQVEETWYEPIINKDVRTVGGATGGQPAILASTNFGIDQRLKNIYVSLDFNNATIEEATNYLSIESKRLDPEHKGVNFVIQPEASTSAKPVSITLNNLPLGEALRYVCQLASVKFKVHDYAISIVPFSQNTDDLVRRTFIVQPSFVAPPSSGTVVSATTGILSGGGGRVVPTQTAPTTGSEVQNDTVLQALISKGVKFPPGASAVYTPATGELTVVNTPDQMELLEELVNAGQAPTLMVRIAAKFVEINQDDLNDLTVNSAYNFLNPNGFLAQPLNTDKLFTGSSFNTFLPGARGFSPDSIDQLLSPHNVNSNTFFFHGMLEGQEYNVVVSALSQKKSFDLLSEPTVLTKSGEQGVLESVRVFPYPISFDPPELVTQTSNNSTITLGAGSTGNPPTVIPTLPTDFKRRNVGVRLVIKPQVTADNHTIDLSLFPEVTDFEGFINYGSQIFVANPDGSQSLLSNNVINQPVFNTRRINTKVLVRDGSTVVLGGLIRNDLQSINDKVPFLGDIPMLGRLFQSKAIQNNKRNLIIFVTANIYRTDGELLNAPEIANTTDLLTGPAGFAAPPKP